MGGFTKPQEEDLGKGWLFELDEATIFTNRIFSTFGFLFCVASLLWIIRRNNQSTHIKAEKKMVSKLWYATLAIIIANAIQQLTAMFTAFPWFYPSSGSDCFTLNIINYLMYTESKFFFWLYSTIRIYEVFHSSSSLAYNNTFLAGLVVFFQIEVVVLNIVHILYGGGVIRSASNERICLGMVGDDVPMIMAPVEIVSNFLCLGLFWYKMKKLWKLITSVHMDPAQSKTVELAYVLKKYTVLTGTMVISTIVLASATAVVPILWTFIAIDTILNIVCLVLFDKRFDAAYQRIFFCTCAGRKKYEAVLSKLKLQSTTKDMTNTEANSAAPTSQAVTISTDKQSVHREVEFTEQSDKRVSTTQKTITAYDKRVSTTQSNI